MDEQLKVCIDRVLPRDTMRHQPTTTVNGRTSAVNPRGKNWVIGSTLKVRFLGGTANQQATAKEQAAWWSAVANLKFDFGNDPASDIRIAFDSNDGAWSYIGTDCKSIPLDQPTMNLGFLDGGTAAHEFGHAIGLGHEHQNPAGGIEWNESVVIQSLKGSPNFWTEAQIRHNVLTKYTAAQVNGTAFDPNSIMLYFFPGSWVRSGVGTHANEILSAVDKSYIASATAYPPSTTPAPPATELKVNAGRRTAATIGTPGEQDLYTFTVAKAGTHIVDTRGSTDVSMKLFGPDSTTALIAEDDDSGYGSNARIAASLVLGTYLVQIQHFDAAGTGAYSVRVRRP
jgi:hypothetical protein